MSNPIDLRQLIDLSSAQELGKTISSINRLSKALDGLVTSMTADAPRAEAALGELLAQVRRVMGEVQGLSVAQREERAALGGLATQLGTYSQQVKAAQDAEAGRAKTVELAKNSVAGMRAELSRLKGEYERLDPTLAADKARMAELETQARALRLESNRLGKAFTSTATSITAATGSYNALLAENKQLTAQLKAMPGGFDATSEAATRLKAQIAANTETLKVFDKEIGQSYRDVGNYAEGIIKAIEALRKKRTALTQNKEALEAGVRAQNALIVAQRGSTEAVEKAKAKLNGYQAELDETERELRQVNVQLNQFNQQVNTQVNQTNIFQSAASGAKGLIGALIGGGGLIGALYLLKRAFDVVFESNLSYSDAAADVRKTTGLTADEFDNLAESLKKVDTRTSLAELLNIAKIGGQLGVAKKDIEGFTKSIDVLVQALGDDFGAGGAEQIATEIGKLNTVFGKQLGGSLEENLLNIGDAINQLGAEGAATSPFLADVALRVGAVAANAKLGLGDVLSYAAVLEETGFTAEVAGTALNRIIGYLTTKTEKFYSIAKIADGNLTLKEFTRLVNTDVNRAFDLFLKGLNKGGSSTTSFARLVEELGFKGTNATAVLTTLAKNTDLVADRQRVANEQLGAASSVAAEAAIKNDTLAGSWEKLKNDISNTVTSGAVGRFFKSIIDYSIEATAAWKLAAHRIVTLFTREQAPVPTDALDAAIDKGNEQVRTMEKQASGAKALSDRVTGLYEQYRKLSSVTDPTTAQQQQLSSVLLSLREALGANVVAIDKETGAYKANDGALSAAVEGRKRATTTAVRQLAERLNQLQQEKASLEALAGAEEQLATKRRNALLDTGLTRQQLSTTGPAAVERLAAVDKAGGSEVDRLRVSVDTGFSADQIRDIGEYDKALSKAARTSREAAAISQQLETVLASLARLGYADAAAALALLSDASKQSAADSLADKEAKNKLLEAEYRLAQFRLEQQAKTQDRVAADPARTEADRTAAIKKAIDLRTQAEAKGLAADLLNDKLTLDQRTLLREKFEAITEEMIRKGTEQDKQLHKQLRDELGLLDVQRLEAENELLARQRDNEDRTADERIAAAEALRKNLVKIAEERNQAEVRAANGAENLLTAAAERRAKAEKEAATTAKATTPTARLTDVSKADTIAQTKLETEQIAALKAGSYANLVEQERDYQLEVRRLKREADLAEIAQLEQTEGRAKEAAERRLELLREDHERELEEVRRKEEEKQAIIAASFQTVDTLAASFFQISADRRQAEFDYVSAERDREVEAAGDNLKAKEEAEARFAERQRKIRIETAKQEKAQALFSIALNTAQAVMAVLSTGGGTHYLDFGTTAGILSALVTAQGLAQAAAVIAKPLPQYYKGARNLATEQVAWVGERGAELVATPRADGVGKDFHLTPDTATLARLPKGTDVYTADETSRLLQGWQERADTRGADQTMRVLGTSAARIEQVRAEREAAGLRALAEATTQSGRSVVRAIDNKTETHIVGSLEDGLTVWQRKGAQWTRYADTRFNRP